MTRWRAIRIIWIFLLVMGLTTCGGCADAPATFYPVDLAGPSHAYVTIADERAEKVLQAWNESPLAAELSTPRKLTLADYQETASIFCLQEFSRQIGGGSHRPVLSVHYELKRDVKFPGLGLGLGHPRHFNIWVYLDTNQTKVFGGE